MTEDRPRSELVPDRDVAGAFVVRTGETEQSWVDPEDPTRLEFDYVQRIADALDACAPAGERLRVVHIGGAGMTLPRYVAHTRPRSAQIVLEPDAELTQVVRERLPLGRHSGIKVRAVDGLNGIAAMPADYADVVVLDAFVGGQVPPELTTTEFLADVARVLTPAGTFMANLTDLAPFDYGRRVLAGIAEHWPHRLVSSEPATLKGRRLGNLVMLGSARPLPVEVLSRKAAGSAFPYRLVVGDALAKWLRGQRPFTVADAAPSPEPRGGLTHFS
ncbi:spermidine synthase [Desertihabitans aurantiacus]|uniref:spermidine synthase n=1 Tax=Desertihabitans aurantiacus TaxID=2282477 RepID=UPI000DF77935|nr:fused MFS/spermidine synthase [Desertihabitans aurantiacus]